MNKRFQVFISSTYIDLIDERKEIMQALLELDCLPAGMELFPAASQDQWTFIQKVIDDSDYYILIIGGRYGSTTTDGISYTEMEYDYAISRGKPVIAFLHNNIGDIPTKFAELDQVKREKLTIFRDKAQGKLCKHWGSVSELGGVVSRSLIQLMKTHPAEGWVRGNYASDPETINMLNTKIKKLEDELNSAKTEAPKGSIELMQDNDPFTFTAQFRTNYKNYTIDVNPTWNQLIRETGPLMYDESTELLLKKAVNNLILRDFIKDSDAGNVTFDQKDFFTILTQLKALGLIKKSDKKRTASDRATYWSLTPYGESKVSQLIAIRRL